MNKASSGVPITWVLICFLSVGNFNAAIFPAVPGIGSLNQAIYSVLVALLGFRYLTSPKSPVISKNLSIILLLLNFYCFISFSWSDDPLFTLAKSSVFLFIPFAIIYSTEDLSDEFLLKGVLYGVCLALILSVVCIYLYPDIAAKGDVYASKDSWRGAFPQKNVLGRTCMIAACATMLLMFNRWIGFLRGVTILLLSCFLVYRSESTTSMMGILLFIPLFAALFAVVRLGKNWSLLLVVLALFGVTLFAFMLDFAGDMLSSAIGKDTSFTGRVPLWSILFQDWAERPLLGFGVGGYFTEYKIQEFTRMLGWDANNAHNGFLEALLDVGLVGIFILLIVMYALLKKSVLIRSKYNSGGQFVCFVLAVLVIQNTMESAFLRPSNIMWVMFVAACIHVSSLEVRGERSVEPN